MQHDARRQQSCQLQRVQPTPRSCERGTTFIAGYVDLTVAFWSDNGWVHVKLHDVAHASLWSYNLISISALALKGQTYAGNKDEATLKLKGRRPYIFP